MAEFMVYFIRVDGNPLLKVGRTRDIVNRVRAYEHNSGGTARCVAQMTVSTLRDSVRLETHAINYLTAHYKQSQREWFAVPVSDDKPVIASILASAPVAGKEQRGRPGNEDDGTTTLAEEAGRVARSVARDYMASRGRAFNR